MKRTDYQRIAPVYDQAELRHRIPLDLHLRDRVSRSTSAPFAVLDVACGTGNYLRVQRDHFPDPRITWSGVDASPDMLARARPKLPGVDLQVARAEKLPFADATFDYVSVNFAFHHFDDKPTALHEMARVLRPDGGFRMSNLAIERMRDWWVFQFFSESRPEDEKRFWSTELVMHELEQRGFSVEVDIETRIRRRSAATLVREAEKRDLSSVAVASEGCFEMGLSTLRQLAQSGATVIDTEAIMIVRAERPGA